MKDTSFQEYKKSERKRRNKHRWEATQDVLSDFLGLLGGLVAITIFILLMWVLNDYMKG